MNTPRPSDQPSSRQQAARAAAAELFVRNVDCGDNHANDALIAELCRRTREQQCNPEMETR